MRYHLNVSDGHGVALDREGAEIERSEVQEEALAAIRGLLSAGDMRGLCRRHWRMDVTDDAGAEVLTVPFGHALTADRVLVAPSRT
jgi:hypothetical protein